MKDDTVADYTRPTPSLDVSKSVRKEQEEKWKSNHTSFFEQGGSSGNVVPKPMIKFMKESGCPNATKVNNTENTRKPTVKYAEMYRNTSQSPRVRGNQRNWNNQKSQQLGKDIMMQNKACYNCGNFDHLEFNYNHNTWMDKGKTWKRVNYAQDNMKHTPTHKSMTPRAVLLKSGTKPINRPFSIARPTLKSAQPKMTSFVKTAQSNVKRPFEIKSTTKNKVWVPTVTPKIPTVGSKVPIAKPTVAADKGDKGKAIKASAHWIWKPKQTSSGQGLNFNGVSVTFKKYQYIDIQGRLKHMTGNISYLSGYEPFNRRYVSFGHGRGKITGKGSIKTSKLKFENVYFMEELKYNQFSVSQICDNKNSVLFTDTECLVLGKDFKPLVDESMLWHRRLSHLNFKTMNKLVRSNLVKDLTSKSFKNDHYYVACLKGKQHKASCKCKLVNSVSKPLHTLHMDLFRPTSVSSLNHKWYCLVVTDVFSRGEFRNKEMDEFCSRKGIKREFSNARTPQHNGVAERRNRTLIEAARTMLADAKLPTAYELFNERSPAIGFLRPFRCHVMILNTLDHLGKFDAKEDEGYFVGYSLSSKAFKVFNKKTKKIEENLHVDFLENKSIEKGTGPDWLFDIDTLTNSMNYVPVVVAGTSSTNILGIKEDVHQAAAKNDDEIPDNNSPQKEQQEVNRDKEVPKSSRNSNPTSSSKVSTNDSFELASSSTVETDVPTVSSPVPTDRLYVPPTTSISLNEVEVDLSNMDIDIQVSPTPTLRIHKDHPKNKVEKAMYRLDQAPRAWYDTLSKYLLDNGFQRGLQVVQKKDGIFLLQDKYVDDILKQFGYTDIRAVKTPMDRENPWGKDGTGKDVELHLYRSMIGSLMYLTTSRLNIMFAVCACARHQVTPKECHLHAVKRIFRYLKGNPKLGLWYPKEYPFDLVSYSDSDYDGANQDRKSTTGGCQFLGRRYGEAFPNDTSLDTYQDMENIAKTSTMPHEALPRVTSLGGGEGSMDLLDKDKSAYKGSDSTDEMPYVLGSLGAANILASGGLRSVFTTASLSVATASGSFPTAAVFTTASVATPTTRVTRSLRGVVIGSSSLISVNIPSISKKDKGKILGSKKLDSGGLNSVFTTASLSVATASTNLIIREQAKRDSEIARIHAEKELKLSVPTADVYIAKKLSTVEDLHCWLKIRSNQSQRRVYVIFRM
nr:uncharacterized mitochondrial protein AtMg00810-like [Tanacetum cinerariifolium]